MEFFHAIRKKTFFSNPLLEAYYEGESLRSFHSYTPDLGGVKDAMNSKSNFSQQKRDDLVKDLYRQYDEAEIDLTKSNVLKNNIDKLKEPNTFTITTGQQIHLGLGPLYVLYKIFDVIAISRQLSEQYADKQFIPVFWMATEDHDLDEIASLNYYGNQIRWDTNQSGAVGRMNTEGVAEIFYKLIETQRISEAQRAFLNRAAQVYHESQNLSVAFRRLLHDYLGDTGLIIIDPDSKVLKSSFTTVMIDELNHSNKRAIQKTTSRLEESGFKKQLRIKPCNLFLLQKNDRIRIDKLSDISNENPTDFVKNNFENLSPNAALRPLYQEWILPNVCSVLGSSELNYWLQLKGLFDTYELPMPSLHVRTSCVVIPNKFKKEFFDNNSIDWFEDEKVIALKQSQKLSNLRELHDEKLTLIKSSIAAYDQEISKSFKGFNLVNKWSKLLDKLNDIERLVEKQWSNKISDSAELKRVMKIKKTYFNPVAIQERQDHLGMHSGLLAIKPFDIERNFGSSASQKVVLIFS